MKSKYIYLFLFLVTLGGLLCAIFLPSVSITRSIAYKSGASTQARGIVGALLTYSISRVEPVSFPDHLYELEVLGLDYDLSGYRDPESGIHYDWLYFGRGVTPDRALLDSEFILIAAPTLFNHKGQYPAEGEAGERVVAYMDGSTGVLSETAFIKQIKLQKAAVAASASTTQD